MSTQCLTAPSSPTAWRSCSSGGAASRGRPPVPRSPFQVADTGAGQHSAPSSHLGLSVQVPRQDSVQNAGAMCTRSNSCMAANAMSAALSVALSLEASPSKVLESIIDFGSDVLLDVVPLSQLLSSKAATSAAAATGAGAMHILTQHCDASCLGNTLADGGHMLSLAQHLTSVGWLADGLSSLADDAIGGQLLKLIAAAGVALAIRRAIEPVAPTSPRPAASAAQLEAAVAPLATTIALGLLAGSSPSPVPATALMTINEKEPLVSPKAVVAAAKAAAGGAIKDVTSWPNVVKRRMRKAVSDLNEGKLSLMGVLVVVDIAAMAHNASDVAQVVQQVAGSN